MGTAGTRLEEVLNPVPEPGVSPFLPEQEINPFNHRFTLEHLPALLTTENGDGYTPGALAGQAPVRPV